ncbi:MAG: alpha/beta hydrolase, partial [Amphiplicatus sp.]
GPMHKVMLYLFGRYIVTPPVEMILAHGYGLAVLYPSEAVPDDKEAGSAALAALAEGHADTATRWGAIAAWGWLYSRAADALLADERIDPKGLIAWGHSRYAKAALLAAAFDDRFDAVIAHQSGAGGASLNRKKAGESIKAITKTYPHWFSARYARYADKAETLPVDQHQLLALVAPRPILLGNARRDVWSDPAGALRAARGADPVYELYGETGLDQARMTPFSPQAELSFWIRPGTHGVVEEDWPAFLAFLDAHIGARRIAAPRTSSR